jgi:Tfp pilus assembly protein PilE
MNQRSYNLRLEPTGIPSSSGFAVTADPGNKVGDECGTLSLDHTGARGISSETGTVSACWGGR